MMAKKATKRLTFRQQFYGRTSFSPPIAGGTADISRFVHPDMRLESHKQSTGSLGLTLPKRSFNFLCERKCRNYTVVLAAP